MVYSVASGIPRGMGVSGYLVHGCIRVSGTKVYGTAWLNLTSKYLLKQGEISRGSETSIQVLRTPLDSKYTNTN